MIDAQKIKNAREEILGMTQEEFARVFEVSPRTIMRWENQDSVPQGSALKKLQQLINLLEDKPARSELSSLKGKADSVELLRTVLNQAIISPGVISGSWGFSPVMQSKASGLIPGIGAMIAGATSAWGVYKLLRQHFETNEFAAVYGPIPAAFYCLICKCKDSKKLLHCIGTDSENMPCTFVVCQECIYNSKEAHKKHCPTCNRINIPSFEPFSDE